MRLQRQCLVYSRWNCQWGQNNWAAPRSRKAHGVVQWIYLWMAVNVCMVTHLATRARSCTKKLLARNRSGSKLFVAQLVKESKRRGPKADKLFHFTCMSEPFTRQLTRGNLPLSESGCLSKNTRQQTTKILEHDIISVFTSVVFHSNCCMSTIWTL